jgi:hypothetical protein
MQDSGDERDRDTRAVELFLHDNSVVPVAGFDATNPPLSIRDTVVARHQAALGQVTDRAICPAAKRLGHRAAREKRMRRRLFPTQHDRVGFGHELTLRRGSRKHVAPSFGEGLFEMEPADPAGQIGQVERIAVRFQQLAGIDAVEDAVGDEFQDN